MQMFAKIFRHADLGCIINFDNVSRSQSLYHPPPLTPTQNKNDLLHTKCFIYETIVIHYITTVIPSHADFDNWHFIAGKWYIYPYIQCNALPIKYKKFQTRAHLSKNKYVPKMHIIKNQKTWGILRVESKTGSVPSKHALKALSVKKKKHKCTT